MTRHRAPLFGEIFTRSPPDTQTWHVRLICGLSRGNDWCSRQGDLTGPGGTTFDTWAFGDTAPGPLIRAIAGVMLRIRVDNQLPTDTSVHWHGIALRNVADGVTQDPIAAGSSYLYEFTAPDRGFYAR